MILSHQKKAQNYAISNNVDTLVHKFSKTVHKYAYKIKYTEKGQSKSASGVMEAANAADAILCLLEEFPAAQGKVSRVKE